MSTPAPAAPSSVPTAHAHAAATRRLGRDVVAALRRVFPPDVVFTLTATGRNGKIRIKLESLYQEPGWTDSSL